MPQAPDLKAVVQPLGLALAGDATAALDPAALAPQAERAVAELLAQGSSQNTQRSYRGALRYWAAWHYARYRRPIALPLEVAVVTQFIVDHAQREDAEGHLTVELPESLDALLVQARFKGRLGAPALATLGHRLSVISMMHQVRDLENPCHHASVRELLVRIRRAYATRGSRERPKAALVRQPLEMLLATCDKSLRGKRDRALLLFAWASGGRRRSEVAAARVEDLRLIGREFLYSLARSKDQMEMSATDTDKPIQGRAARALSEWLAASQITEGPIFRRISKGGRVGECLSAAAVRDIVKARCKLAGLREDFSAHSLRSGFVTEASVRGASIGDIMGMTGHASPSTVLRYHRRASALTNPAARLLEPPPPTYANASRQRAEQEPEQQRQPA